MNTVFETVLAGVTVYVAGQFIIKFIIEPVLNFKELLGKISHTFLNNQSEILQAHGAPELRTELFFLAATLLEKRQAITWYRGVSRMFSLPSSSEVLAGSRYLNLLSSR